MTDTWKTYNYDLEVGWFYNKPAWYEVVIKYNIVDSTNREMGLMLDWIKSTGADMDNVVIWRDTKNHLKLKFKDIELSDRFKSRWSDDWVPGNPSIKYNYSINVDRSNWGRIISVLEEKMGRREVDWDYGLSGVWFKKRTDITKIQLLLRPKEKNRSILRPISKSLIHENKEFNNRVSLDFLPSDNNTFTISFGTTAFAPTLPGLSDYSRKNKEVIGWCHEFLAEDSWRIEGGHIYLSNDSDATLFMLRWL